MRATKILLAVAAGLSMTAEAVGSGFYNMPTSLQQCLGVGFGPGYHAPMLLGPMLRGSVEQKPIKRVRHPFAPPLTGAGFAEPTRMDYSHSQQGSPSLHHYTGEAAYSAPMHTGAMVGQPMMGQPIMASPYQSVPQGAVISIGPPTNAVPSGAEVVPAPQPSR